MYLLSNPVPPNLRSSLSQKIPLSLELASSPEPFVLRDHRMNITAKSPESGHLGRFKHGGRSFGAELVKGGFSHLEIKGKSQRPVYLSYQKWEDPSSEDTKLWGQDTVETQRIIVRS